MLAIRLSQEAIQFSQELVRLRAGLVVDGEVGDRLLGPRVLDLKFPKSAGLLGLRAAVLIPPAIEPGFADP